MGAEKPKTTDEYVLAELEKQKLLTKTQKKRIDELEELLAQKTPIPPEPTIEETKFKCYHFSVLSEYTSDWNKLVNPLTTAKMKELIDDENLFKAWATTAIYEYYSDKQKVLEVRENLYNFEINYFGILIGVAISRYYSGELNVNHYIIDDKHHFSDHESCKEAGLQQLRENFIKVYTRRCKEEAKAAAESTFAENTETPDHE